MKFAWFLSLYYYILNGSYPTDASKVIKQKIRRHAANLEIRGEALVEKKTGKEVLHDANVRKVLLRLHEENHLGPVNLHKQAKMHFVFFTGSLSNICKAICTECITCQMRARVKVSRTQKARPIPTPGKLNYCWGVDAVGPLPATSKGEKYILTGVEFLSRWPVAKAVTEISEETTCEFYFSEIVSRWGVCNFILSDRGSNFDSRYTKAFLQQLGCKAITTTAYRPNSNGQSERLNQTLCRTIAKLARDKNDIIEWSKYIPQALMVIRSMENITSGYSPAQLVYGQHMITPATWSAPIYGYVEGEYEEDLARRVEYVTEDLQKMREESRIRSDNAKAKYAAQYNKRVHVTEPFKIGEQVLLKEFVTESKFADKWRGPYVVIRREKNVYYLDGPNKARIKKGVNADALKPFSATKTMVPDVTTANAYEYFKTWVEAKSQ
ncbi:hypothetical protein [Parasitella parasitica]|uniref:Integrase catalytic domain-containing protein n=1 Tax=Parasitella parasitica TaxID=35722 RepID=A0A0B7MM30_9FUNG|nr:hypothetical protein [Parasitella parasitica]